MLATLATALMAAIFGLGLRLGGVNQVVLPLVLCALSITWAYLTFFLGRQGLPPVAWYWLLGACIVGVSLGFGAARIWEQWGTRASVAKFIQTRRANLALDFRAYAVLIGLIVSYLMTYYFSTLAFSQPKSDFWFEFYVSWVAGLLFFTVVGLLVGLVALYRPERDVFPARVKILVGGKSGPAIDFIGLELRKIGHVARCTRRKITVEDFDADRKAFRIKIEHEGMLINIYDDVETIATGSLGISPDKFDPPIPLLGQIVSFRVNGTGQPDLPISIGPDGMRKDWSIPIPGGGEGNIYYEHWGWYSADEEHWFTPVRYTERLEIEFVNRCHVRDKNLQVNLKIGLHDNMQILGWDGVYAISDFPELGPGKVAYKFKLALI